MLLAGTHLLPDLSGALILPGPRVVACADPIALPDARQAPEQAAGLVHRLGAVLRQRRPAAVAWLGPGLPTLLALNRLNRRDGAELARLVAAQPWVWLADALPPGLPGESAVEWKAGGITFRHDALPQGSPLGEVSGRLHPMAQYQGQTWPCYVLDGRRMVLPAFGAASQGTNVLSPAFPPLFRRPFQVLMLAGGRFLSKPRAALDLPAPPPRAFNPDDRHG